MPLGIYKRTAEAKENMRKSKLGNKNPMYGKRLTPEHKLKLSEGHSQQKHYRWLGQKVGYRGLHLWVKKYRGIPKICSFCGKEKTTPKSIHWANKSHRYLRDLKDWIELCAKCHKIYDIKFKKKGE